MKIECKIRRQGGSVITLDGKRYHFAPDDLGRHVAEVTHQAHIDRFLEIPGYREVADDGEAPATATTEAETLTPEEPELEPEPVEEPEEPGEPEEPEEDDEERALETARQAYREAFGKKPNARMHADTMWERIAKGEP